MMQGYWLKMARVVTRVALGIAAVLLFIPTLPTDIAGLVLIVAISIFNYKSDEGELATQEW
jgi:UPF0716 family protein affecting phage T7 exclusion